MPGKQLVRIPLVIATRGIHFRRDPGIDPGHHAVQGEDIRDQRVRGRVVDLGQESIRGSRRQGHCGGRDPGSLADRSGKGSSGNARTSGLTDFAHDD
jgi:hypothetical protein